jgi:hypothetical protein
MELDQAKQIVANQGTLDRHPGPWRHGIAPGGQVIVLDTNNQEVPLLEMVEFAKLASHVFAPSL